MHVQTNLTSPDYFERLGLPQQFALDGEALRKAYFRLQQEYHPDRAGNDPAEKAQSAMIAANINEAYHTLKNPLLRAKHLLHLNSIEVNGERDTVKPSVALLMEVMEWRERAEGAFGHAALEEELTSLETEIEKKAALAFEANAWQDAAQLVMRWHYLQKTRADLKASLHARKEA